jgi:hypothetical protein
MKHLEEAMQLTFDDFFKYLEDNWLMQKNEMDTRNEEKGWNAAIDSIRDAFDDWQQRNA